MSSNFLRAVVAVLGRAILTLAILLPIQWLGAAESAGAREGIVGGAPATQAATRPARLSLGDFAPAADGVTDDTPAFTRCFSALANAGGGVLVIPPGQYLLGGRQPIPLASNCSIDARGARFLFPRELQPNKTANNRFVLFEGKDITDLTWQGGHFQGYCFDPARTDNTWEPSASTRGILITTSPGGRTEKLTFRDVTSDHVAGAVITVLGASKSESQVITHAGNITLDNCTLLSSGKFMWDYGYLWQITVWPEDHTAAEIAMAKKYFRNDLVRGPLEIKAHDDRIGFDNSQRPIKVSRTWQPQELVCFFGDALPPEIVRGKQYLVVESTATHIKIADKLGAEPIRFSAGGGRNVQLVWNLAAAFMGLYAPTGSGPGKGAFDLTACRGVRVTGCKLSALGDTMHIHSSQDVVFANNHILGSRMGAFFIAEFCANVTITGNLVDGTNGSRVMSVEKSTRDITIVGNTFRNGGRGSWINQPTNFVLQGNVFINNTTKCEKDPRRGRRKYLTGDYEEYAELYFTTWQPGATYGGIIVRDNIFVTGPEASDTIAVAPGAREVLITGNIFRGGKRTVRIAPDGCEGVVVKDNLGLAAAAATGPAPISPAPEATKQAPAASSPVREP